MSHFHSNQDFVRVFKALPLRKQRQLLKLASRTQILALSEVILNCCRKTFPISSKTLDKIKSKKNVLRELSCPKTSLCKRRKLLHKGCRSVCAIIEELEIHCEEHKK